MNDRPNSPIRQPRTIRDIFRELSIAVSLWLGNLIDLKEGLDREGTIISIKTNKKMHGANAWLLMCSIMIASLGLDLNSPAVIIGAMLISPLMAPILGIGLGIGTNDKDALLISLRHFSIAIFIALLTSTFYFLITPLGTLTNEIQARTAPTLLDGLVAIFGGLAGIISASRKDKSSAIPGVAIATALMPPLCVTGYGLANANWNIALNSFYLFFLNSFFIALATYIIIRILNFPYKKHVDLREARRNRWIITLFSMIIVIPSGRILYDIYMYQRDKQRAEQFIDAYFSDNPNTKCIDYSLIREDTSQQLILQLLGESIPQDSLDQYYRGMQDFGLHDTRLSLIQDSDLELQQINKMKLELSSLGQIASKLETVSKAKTDHELRIDRLQGVIDSLRADTIPFIQIKNEARVLFPDLISLAYARAQKTDFQTPAGEIPLFLIQWDAGKPRSLRRSDEKKLYEFLKLRASLDTLQIIPY